MDSASGSRLPPVVARALELERELGFGGSSIPEVGRLLHVLAGQGGRARVGEIGTGAGVGAAWIVSAKNSITHRCPMAVDHQQMIADGLRAVVIRVNH